MGFWSSVGKTIGTVAVGTAIVAAGPFAIPLGAVTIGTGLAFKDMAENVAEDGLAKDTLEFVGDCYIGGGSNAVLKKK